MAVPTVESVAEGTQTSDSATWTLSYPSGADEGKLVIFVCSVDGNPNPTSVSATDFVSAIGFGLGLALGKRVVPAGGLSGTFTVTFNAAEQGAWKVLVISPWDGTLGINWTNSDSNGGMVPAAGYHDGTGTAPNPNGMSPFGWDASAEDTLYLGVCCADGGDTTFSATPANYSVVGSNQSSGGADGAALSVVSRQVAAEPEDIGPWTLSASVLFRALAIAVRGGEAGLQSLYTIVNGSDQQLANVNAAGDDVDAYSWKIVPLSEAEIAALLDGTSFGQRNIAVLADLTSVASPEQHFDSVSGAAEYPSS